MSNIGGRPTVITSDTVKKLEDAFKAGFSVSEACTVSGISRVTYYNHLANDERFSYKMELAKKWVTLQAKHVIVQAITANSDVPSSKWWLERKSRSEFGTNAIDEDAQWEAQHATDNQEDDVLRRILDMMSDSAEEAIESVTTEAPVAQQTTQHEVPKPSQALPEPALAHSTQRALEPTDILADLYED